MRLIDADALFREMEKAGWYDNADRDEIAEELVLNAPTIEPERKTGRWINNGRTVRCSECDTGYNTVKGMRSAVAYNFCPNCGASMMEVGHETD